MRHSLPKASSCMRHAVRDRRLAQRVVVLLRVLAERRVDQHLHFAVQDEVDTVGTALVNLEHPSTPEFLAHEDDARCLRCPRSLKPISWNRRAIGVTASLSKSFTVRKSCP